MKIYRNVPPDVAESTKVITALIACQMPQFIAAASGTWWFAILVGFGMYFIFRQFPIQSYYKEIRTSLWVAQAINLIGGSLFYFLTTFRSEIALGVGSLLLLFPVRKLIVINKKLYRKL
ncbi:MAG: hypothetical protein KJ850_03610 [Gammaproteobacteria bacterium]|nr:hypothetical protein [Gammaproteobacteria bacterium]MBU1624115.1 hypothetical protein [Gammaproteobacteria bacterium]MBU1981843.1 hypothetical protein [Gammaproteobacteria bacterium]